MCAKIISASRVELSVEIPQGLETSVSVLFEGTEAVTVHSSQNVLIREQGSPESLHKKSLTCMAASSDLIGLGNGKTIIFELLEDGCSVDQKSILVKPGELDSLQPVTFYLLEE